MSGHYGGEPRPSDSEIQQLKTEIPERFEGWVFAGLGGNEYHGWVLSAERPGTKDRQHGSTRLQLFDAIEAREFQLRSIEPTPSVQVTSGLNTTTHIQES